MTVTTWLASEVDLVSPEAVRDPYSVFRELREHSSIYWLKRHRAWLLLDHDLVRLAVNDEELSTDTITPLAERLDASSRERFAPAEALLRDWMIFNDPPVHTSLRTPIRNAFTHRSVAALADDIRGHVDRILGRMADGDVVDLIGALAFPLPATVIAVLLGVPLDRHDEFRNMSKYLGALVMGKVSRADAWDRALQATADFHALFEELIKRYRREPADNLVSRLVVAADDPDSPFTSEQLVGACSLLLFGGHETTTGLISNGILALLQDPVARARLRADPDLTASTVEELLRFDGPSKIVVRRARTDGEWQGIPLRASDAIFCALASANRDPDAFESPDVLMVDRAPNRHLGFGFGRHLCLGAQLARIEAQIVIPEFLNRFPNAELACDVNELEYQPTIVGRTMRRLPVRLGEPAA